jgi:hypothetical protein
LAENTNVNSKGSDYLSKKSMGEMERNLAVDDATFAIMYACTTRVSVRWTARRK